MKTFAEYLSSGIVRKQKANPERAKSLLAEAEKKRAFMIKVIENFSLRETEPNFVVESCYDILIELIRAKMFFDGYNSQSSHEAEVSYMGFLSFSNAEIIFMDELRYFRNGIKYYGRIMDFEYVQKVLEFHNRIYPRLKMRCRA